MTKKKPESPTAEVCDDGGVWVHKAGRPSIYLTFEEVQAVLAVAPLVKGTKVVVHKIGAVPDHIRHSGSMKDILTWLSRNGATNNKELVAACHQLRPSVPIFQRVPDLDGRVKKAADILGLFRSRRK